ncbi:MAG: hypothetical protein ACOYJO_01380 [Eubacterium sp.]|jgi:hypothetical protein
MNLTFKSILDASGFEFSDVDEARSHRTAKTVKALSGLTIASAVFCAAAYFTEMPHGTLSVPVLMVMVLALYQTTIGPKKRMIALLNDKCDPEVFMKKYMTFLASGISGSDWDEHCFNVAMALHSAGRFDDGKKVLEVFGKFSLNEKGRFRLALAKAFYAYEDGDAGVLSDALYSAKVERQKIDTTGPLEDMYREAEDLPVMLSVISKRDYKMGFEAFAEHPDRSDHRTNLAKVRLDYFLWTLAKGMDDDYLIKRYADEIMKIGGTTWYRREMLSSGKTEE